MSFEKSFFGRSSGSLMSSTGSKRLAIRALSLVKEGGLYAEAAIRRNQPAGACCTAAAGPEREVAERLRPPVDCGPHAELDPPQPPPGLRRRPGAGRFPGARGGAVGPR